MTYYLMIQRHIIAFLAIILSTSMTVASPNCASLLNSEGPLERFNPAPGLLFRGVVYQGNSNPLVRQVNLADGSEDNFRFKSPEGFFQSKAFLVDYVFGLKTVHKAYGNRLSQLEKDIVQYVDLGRNAYIKDLETHRVSFGLSFADGRTFFLKNAEHAGFLRVVESTDSSVTPSEQILRDKGIQSNYFSEKRAEGYSLFEIGKFSINKSLNSTQRQSVKRELLRWLYDYFLRPGIFESEKVIFIIDVSNPSHTLLYQREYGAKSLNPELFDPPLKEPDSILTVDLSTLRKMIGEQLGRSPGP